MCLEFWCPWLRKNAAQYYEKAISIGLPDEELKGAYLGLGSTYRTLGKYDDSKKVLEERLVKFPQDEAMKVFYAMTLYNLKEYSKAMEILLSSVADTSSDENINKYKKSN